MSREGRDKRFYDIILSKRHLSYSTQWGYEFGRGFSARRRRRRRQKSSMSSVDSLDVFIRSANRRSTRFLVDLRGRYFPCIPHDAPRSVSLFFPLFSCLWHKLVPSVNLEGPFFYLCTFWIGAVSWNKTVYLFHFNLLHCVHYDAIISAGIKKRTFGFVRVMWNPHKFLHLK